MFGRTHRQVSSAYEQLANLQEAGHPLVAILEFFGKDAPAEDRELAGKLIARVRAGARLHQAMGAIPLPALDTALIRVAEESGKLPEASRLLSAHYHDRHRLERSIRRAVVKPGLLVAATLFLGGLPDLFAERISLLRYLLGTVGVCATACGIGFLAFKKYRAAIRDGTRERTGRFWAGAADRVPWVGSFMGRMAAERFFTCFKLCLEAGCDFPTTFDLAGKAAANPRFARAAATIRESAPRLGIGEAFAKAGIFSREQVQSIRAAEAAGKLEDAVTQACRTLRQEIDASIADFEDWAPKIVYGFAVIYAAYCILSTYEHFSGIAFPE